MHCFRSISLVVLLAMIAPPATAQPEEAVIQGFIWVDENLDGIRELDEPLLGGQEVGITRAPRVLFGARSDSDGKFTIRIPTGYEYTVQVRWGEVVEYRDGGPIEWSHFGCVQFRLEPRQNGDVYRLDIRVRPTRGERPYRVPIAEPTAWPLVEGHFFVALPSGTPLSCDLGFSVTNDDGIPFWDTLLAQGLDAVGRPVSRRFAWEGHLRQAFEQIVMDWNPETQTVNMLPWEEAGMARGSVREGPFIPEPTPHFIGLPSLDAQSPTSVGGAPLATVTVTPAPSAQPDAVIQGYVWVDENLDGIRQAEEPLLPEQGVGVFRDLRAARTSQTNAQGWYSIRIPAGATFWAFHANWGPIDNPVSPLIPPTFMYQGCTVIQSVSAGTTYTLDIRLRAGYDPVVGAPYPVLTPIPEPDRWPVDGGQFFTALPLRLQSPVCDAGFAVTNADGIPFWDTLLARGLDEIGRPVTSRLDEDGHVRQAFEYMVLEWDPDSLTVRVLGWEESGMTRGSTLEEPFAPGPSPHFLGLPSVGGAADVPMADVGPSTKVLTAPSATQPQAGLALVQGYIWVDEDLNAVYDAGEPLAERAVIRRNGQLYSLARTNAEGKFEVRVPVGAYYTFELRWGEALEYDRDGNPLAFSQLSHWGCTSLFVVPGQREYILDLRVREIYWRTRGTTAPLPSPAEWLIDDGMYFTLSNPARGEVGNGCDLGFAVKDAEGILFWDTLRTTGVDVIGRPVTDRFLWNGHIRQGFEHAVLEWDAETRQVLTLTWTDAGMERGRPFEDRLFWPGPAPHYAGLPPLD
jgi:hypothetical protein